MVVVPEITPHLREAGLLDRETAQESTPSELQSESVAGPEPVQHEESVPYGQVPVADSAAPVPVGAPPQRRTLWRRLTRRSESRASDPSGFQDLVKSRLDGITLRLESLEHGLARSEARFDSRFALLESIEERLRDLWDIGKRADLAREAANRSAEAANSAAVTARIAAAIAAIAVVIAVTTLVVAVG